jgi:hypothetical protein
MGLPTQPVTFSPEQLAELSRRLATFRHDINNNLMLISASAELIKLRPENSARMLDTLVDQPQKIKEAMAKFSVEFEAALGITRP